MRKLLIYSATAAIIGLILTLVPVSLVALTELEAGKAYTAARSVFSEGLEKLEGTSGLEEAPKYSVNDVAILAISLIIAFFAYALFKFKMSH